MKKLFLILSFFVASSLFYSQSFIDVQEIQIENKMTKQYKVLSKEEEKQLLRLINSAVLMNERFLKVLLQYRIIIKANNEIFVYFTNGECFTSGQRAKDDIVLYYEFAENIYTLLEGIK